MVITNFVLRLIVFLIALIGTAVWIAWARQKKSYAKLAILPISALLHSAIFSTFALLNSVNLLVIPAYNLNAWSQIVRIHEGIALSLGAISMMMVAKYEQYGHRIY